MVQKTHVFPTIFSFLQVFFSIARLSLNPVCKLFVVGKTHVVLTIFGTCHKNLFLITVCNLFVVENTHVFSYLKYPPDVRICFSIVLVVKKTHVFPTIFSFLRVFFSIAMLSLNPVCKLFVVGKTHVFLTIFGDVSQEFVPHHGLQLFRS